MKTLKVLSALLCYPQPELQAALGEMREVLDQENLLPEREHRALLSLINQMQRADLIELQERYVRLFDRGRALSLHLFEHIHGESRDRGQAMINLLDVYRQHGFELSARELPDYLPLFLEYLAQRPAGEALDMLADTMHVMALLGARLAEQGSDYHAVFDALAALAGEPADIEAIRQQAAREDPDEAIVNMDKIWEEEAVTFLANQEGCGAHQNSHGAAAQPVRWMPPSNSTPPVIRSL
ncbi:MAG TPA: nitrate reductase molybdenum cofactor assembly chaperone [Candidatus Competibacteraceae bacterium]|nr:nitrate reductase molybdenum cofactor assembly chaperone [Candidatus Competibacteraceae bacterium]MCP5133694.1 nitrate reductase molybdenum cofactor assembly chaperone [Gammaproteobacteria bacterium]HPF59995.1 nitrate reductase molybdenum cofactor assembly chaperone [Candidatus Competibacteraceae bacterium]HRY19141.1 nitrate reductase molybdenum cofactor assembly chaperone [Candidatus Competibacteraceae bacterium]